MTELLIPCSGEKERYAVLQRRGEFNHEKLGAESWAGACQVTCHGKLGEGEDWIAGLFREAMEELTPAFGNLLAAQGKGDSDFVLLTEFGNAQSPKWVRTYGILLDVSFFQVVKLSASTGGLKFVDSDVIIENLEPHQKESGVHGNVIAMFADEAATVRRAFEVFKW